MMDFGFAAFLEKFEEHFGRTATKIILILIGLAIVSATGSIIWNTLIKPLVGLLTMPGAPAWERLTHLAWTAILMGGGIGVGFEAIAVLHNARAGRRLAASLRETKEILAESEELQKKIKETVRQAEDVLTTGELTVERVIAEVVERGLVTPDQAAELRSLLDTEPENSSKLSSR